MITSHSEVDVKPNIIGDENMFLSRFADVNSSKFIQGMLDSSMKESFRTSLHGHNPQLVEVEILWNMCFMHWKVETEYLKMPDGTETPLQQIGKYKSHDDLANIMHSTFQEIKSQGTSDGTSPSPTVSGVTHDVENEDDVEFSFAGLDDDTIINQWFQSKGGVSIDTIWKYALEEQNRATQDIDQFLPKDPEVSQWIDTLVIRTNKVSCSLKSYLDKESGVKHVESSYKSRGRQDLSMVQRFYSFCWRYAEYHPSSCPSLSKTLLSFINDDNYVLAFFLLLLRNDRTQKTVSQYTGALTKTVEYLKDRGLLTNTESFRSAMSTLEVMTSGRKVADQRNRLKKSIRQAKRLEDFDMGEIKNLLDVQEVESYLKVLQESFNLRDKDDKNKFLRIQGLILLLFRTFNASHLIDLKSVTYMELEDSLKKATGTAIILEPSTRFKGSNKKTSTTFHLSVPIRYKTSLQLYLKARKMVFVKTKELFVTSRGSPAGVENMTSFINLFLRDKGVKKDLGTNGFRQLIETTAECQLQQARSDAVGLKDAEANRSELSSALIHTADVAKRHYIKLNKKTSAYRSNYIDHVVQQTSTSQPRMVENVEQLNNSGVHSTLDEESDNNPPGSNEDCLQR